MRKKSINGCYSVDVSGAFLHYASISTSRNLHILGLVDLTTFPLSPMWVVVVVGGGGVGGQLVTYQKLIKKERAKLMLTAANIFVYVTGLSPRA